MNIKSSKILIAISGGVAVYKVCSLITSLLSDGAEIRIVMTDSATKFVTPLTFQSLTNNFVYCDLWNPHDKNIIEHIDLAHWPDLVVLVPATANTISKISHGIADNLLTTVILALKPSIQIIIAPAMNTNMWNHSATKENIERLKSYKNFIILKPRTGVLACRDEGIGKIPDNDTIIETIKLLK